MLERRVLASAPALQLQALRRVALALARARAPAPVRRQALPQLARPAGALAVRLALLALLVLLLVRRWPGPRRARPAHRYQGVLGLALACAF